MIGLHPYVIHALLLIYPHSTSQSEFWPYSFVAEAEFRKEKLGVLKTISRAIRKSINVACDELTPDEKQQLCDEAMRFAVAEERYMSGNPNGRNIQIDSFLKENNSTLAIPQLVNPDDAYTCKKIPVAGCGFEKRMFWCNNRVFTVKQSGASDQAEGFFMAGSRKQVDRVFILKPRQANSRKVIPWAMMTSVGVLKNAAVRRGLHRSAGSSSSTAVLPGPFLRK